jgi:soluble lytic murein transglycosylase
MENVLVYRARFEGSGTATAKSEQRVTTHEVSAAPTAAAAAAAP